MVGGRTLAVGVALLLLAGCASEKPVAPTPTVTVTDTQSPSPAPTGTESPSSAPSATASPSPSATTASPTASPSPSPTPSATQSPTPSPSPTRTPSPSPTRTPTPSPTSSPTPELETSVPEIEGTPRYRSELSFDAPKWGPGKVALSYQWLRDGKAIKNATSTSYKAAAADIGHSLRVRVTGRRSGFATATVDTAPVGPVAPGKLSAKTPTIDGSARVGSKLIADVDPWGPGEVKLAWQWYRGDAKIAGATKTSYTLTTDDAGKLIKVRVAGSAPNFANTTKYSEPTGKVALGKLGPTPTPLYSGIAQVGEKVTALPREWGPGNVKLAYQWYRERAGGDVKIAGATKVSYVFTAADLGARLKVRVTGSKAGYDSVSKYSAWTAEVIAGALDAVRPTLSGTPVSSKTLTAKPGEWGPDGVEFSYRWYRDGMLITREFGDTLLLSGADVGHKITVKVRGELEGYTSTTLESAPVGPVAAKER